jgi:hypothetical protein
MIYQDKAKQELNDLATKILRLEEFMQSHEFGALRSSFEKSLLGSQLVFMRGYWQELNKRVSLFMDK